MTQSQSLCPARQPQRLAWLSHPGLHGSVPLIHHSVTWPKLSARVYLASANQQNPLLLEVIAQCSGTGRMKNTSNVGGGGKLGRRTSPFPSARGMQHTVSNVNASRAGGLRRVPPQRTQTLTSRNARRSADPTTQHTQLVRPSWACTHGRGSNAAHAQPPGRLEAP